MSIKNILHCVLMTLLCGHTCHAMSTLKQLKTAARTRLQRFYNRGKQWTAAFQAKMPHDAPSQEITPPSGVSTAYFPSKQPQVPHTLILAEQQRRDFKEGLRFDRVWGMIKDVGKRIFFYPDKEVLEKLYEDMKLGKFIDPSDIPSRIVNWPLLDEGKTLLQASVESGVMWLNILSLLKAGADAHMTVSDEKHPIMLALKNNTIDLITVLMLVNPYLQKRALVKELPKKVSDKLTTFLNNVAANTLNKEIENREVLSEIVAALEERTKIAQENNKIAKQRGRWRTEDL